MAKLDLSSIRARSTGYFFDKETMRYFRGAHHSTRYDRETDTNYVVVDNPQPSRHRAWYRFDERTGGLDYVRETDVPERVRNRGRPYPKMGRAGKPKKKSGKKNTPANFGGIRLKRVF